VWTVENYFWIDLAIGPAIGMLLVAIATGRPTSLVRVLDSRPLRRLGAMSYSLYLIHAPIVLLVGLKVVAPRHGVGGFLMTLALAVPLSLVAAHLFASAFELPFTRRRVPTRIKNVEQRSAAGNANPEPA
jgi:peptidoglycan/LPS O-acetylase OafA/YrhL